METFSVPQDRFADSGGVKLRYRRVGSGEPLLLIMGYGPPSTLWHFCLPYLVDRFECLYFDHRGTGKSDVPEHGYTIEQYARDTLSVMDAVDWESAHVFGASMGGMVAQQLALDAPERVRSLVLGSTSCGTPLDKGAGGVVAVVGGMQMLVEGEIERGVAQLLPYFYGDLLSARPEVGDFLTKVLLDEPPRRLAGPREEAKLWNVAKRLPEIQHPALVVHGYDDRVVDVTNAYRLFDGLPNAELRIFKNAPHSYYAVDPARTLREVGDWILRQARHSSA